MRHEEPGSVRLPVVVFQLIGSVRRDRKLAGALGLGDLGLLTTLAFVLENRDVEILSSSRKGEPARVEEVDGEPVLVVPGGLKNLSFGTANPDREHLGVGSGGINIPHSLRALARNELLVVEDGREEARIRLGERAKMKATTAS